MKVLSLPRLRASAINITIILILFGACGVLFNRYVLRGVLGATIRRHQILNEISSITEDVLLENYLSNLHTLDNDPYECIRGGGELVYGSDRSYDEVVAEYEKALTAKGWIYREPVMPELSQNGLVPYRNLENTIHLVIGPHSESRAEWTQYRTIYYINFLYAEPSVTACYG